VKCSPPGYYQEFLEGLVKIDAEATRRFLVNLGSESYRTGRINDEFIHVVCSGFYAGLFEVVVHDMPREAAEGYIRELRSFYNNGWEEDFLEKNPKARDKMYMATTKARHRYTDVSYEEDAYIMFGKESAGIPEEILVQTPDTAIRIPMNPQIRSLNLSNSVAIVLYEALRQNDFFSMQTEGNLHRLSWENPDIV